MPLNKSVGNMYDFDSERLGVGTMEWAEVTENIQLGCVNNCRYCYAAYDANRFGRRYRSDWLREELTKRAEMKSYPAKDGVIMFPSTHDITPFNVEACLRVLRLMLEKRNRLLIVSKPRPEIIHHLCEQLEKYRKQILFRFTIGSTDDVTLKYWEPGAPCFGERISALEIACAYEFRTSVSAEPLLGGRAMALDLIERLDPLVSDTIWIGKLNKGRLRVWPMTDRTRSQLDEIEFMQNDKEMTQLVLEATGNPKVRWKDSIRMVVDAT